MSTRSSAGKLQRLASRFSSIRWPGIRLFLAGFCILSLQTLRGQAPGLLNYQGRISVGATAFEGTGKFKLALVNADGSQIYWRNAADADNNGEPDASVSLPVSRGLYSLMLGDTNLANMAPLPAEVFSRSAVYLRVWFDDGVGGFQRLTADQRVSSAGYSLFSTTVADGAISTSKLSSDLAAQIGTLTAQVNALTGRVDVAEFSGLTVVSADAQDAALLARGYRAFSSTTALAWSNGRLTDAPAARSEHTAVWTGEEMVIWGGYLGFNNYSASGGRYAPGADSWTTATTFGAPAARGSHSAVWSGTEMVVWGGLSGDGYLSSGSRYNPASQLWTSLPSNGAPSARSDHAAAWTGSQMIVWGGRGLTGYLNDGAVYSPTANQWSPLTATGAPEARHSAAAVWTGDRLLVWGGEGVMGSVHSGGSLVVNEGQTWQPVNEVNAPSARAGHSAVWTGTSMIVWGGRNGSSFLGDGASYNPASNTWTTLPTTGAPSSRADHVALWTGSEMLVLGGQPPHGALATGGAYDPAADKWRALTTSGNPAARSDARAIWTGTEMVVFGGQAGGQPIAALQRLNPQPVWHFYRKL